MGGGGEGRGRNQVSSSPDSIRFCLNATCGCRLHAVHMPHALRVTQNTHTPTQTNKHTHICICSAGFQLRPLTHIHTSAACVPSSTVKGAAEAPGPGQTRPRAPDPDCYFNPKPKQTEHLLWICGKHTHANKQTKKNMTVSHLSHTTLKQQNNHHASNLAF